MELFINIIILVVFVDYKLGFVGIIGRFNVGKFILMN